MRFVKLVQESSSKSYNWVRNMSMELIAVLSLLIIGVLCLLAIMGQLRFYEFHWFYRRSQNSFFSKSASWLLSFSSRHEAINLIEFKQLLSSIYSFYSSTKHSHIPYFTSVPYFFIFHIKRNNFNLYNNNHLNLKSDILVNYPIFSLFYIRYFLWFHRSFL